MVDRRWEFPESFDVGDFAPPIFTLIPAVTCTASGEEQVLIGLRARHYTAWSEGQPVDGFHLYIADGQICPWKSNTMCIRRHTIRDAAAAALNTLKAVT